MVGHMDLLMQLLMRHITISSVEKAEILLLKHALQNMIKWVQSIIVKAGILNKIAI